MGTWEFDSSIADIFEDHASKHIPDYVNVIGKSIEICQYFLKPTDKIIDVGSATGKTIKALHSAGFTNLVGVDSSQAMLDKCDQSIARYITSNNFPQEEFDAIICNWTLHFIKDKVSYIKSMYDSLQPGGILILTEKTSLDPTSIHFYHEYKLSKGVTEEEVAEKEASLVGVMNIDNPEWYYKTLRDVGFESIELFHANWCFSSFLCRK